MPNGKPDPNCPECKGSGQIVLFMSVRECRCIDREESTFVKLTEFAKNLNPIDFLKEYEIESLPFDMYPQEKRM